MSDTTEKSYLLSGASSSGNGGNAGRIGISIPPLVMNNVAPPSYYPGPSPHSPSEGKTHKNLFTTVHTSTTMGGSTYQSLNSFDMEGPGNGEDETKKLSWEQYGRRTLYGSLPFMAAFGMQKKETTLKKVISAVSINTLAKTLEGETEQVISEKVQLEELDVDEVSESHVICPSFSTHHCILLSS